MEGNEFEAQPVNVMSVLLLDKGQPNNPDCVVARQQTYQWTILVQIRTVRDMFKVDNKF